MCFLSFFCHPRLIVFLCFLSFLFADAEEFFQKLHNACVLNEHDPMPVLQIALAEEFVLIRPCYQKLLCAVLTAKGNVAIAGNAGVGKSKFGLFLAWYLLFTNQHQTLAYVTPHSAFLKLGSSKKFLSIPPSDLRFYRRYFNEGSFIICDSCVPAINMLFQCRVVLCTCTLLPEEEEEEEEKNQQQQQNQKDLKRFIGGKGPHPAGVTLYMEAWSQQEVKAFKHTKVPEPTRLARLARYGGIARWILYADSCFFFCSSPHS
jgi:hypothetical protein